ncbi:hypothetical protein GYMLUDRAFT_547572 [Collybiopsis luxurians FD-317 M1]|nr:hypothetical protein GYMLUDRAFT_547572 [Collybiopsis luxurians FD-317 M1]
MSLLNFFLSLPLVQFIDRFSGMLLTALPISQEVFSSMSELDATRYLIARFPPSRHLPDCVAVAELRLLQDVATGKFYAILSLLRSPPTARYLLNRVGAEPRFQILVFGTAFSSSRINRVPTRIRDSEGVFVRQGSCRQF